MTLPAGDYKKQYVGTGGTPVLSIGFSFQDNADVGVIEFNTATNSENTKVEGTDYDVINHVAGGSGDIQPRAGKFPVGVNWSVVRSEELKTTLDLEDGEDLGQRASAIETQLDRLGAQVQQMDEVLSRCLRFPVTDAEALNPELPVSPLRLTKHLATDSSGNVVTSDVATASGTSVISTGSTTARTLEERFSEVRNVKDFGAVGDGVTDDTAAIQAAINTATPNEAVFFPPGRHMLTDSGAGQIAIKDGTKLVGVRGSSIIDFSSFGTPQVDGVFRGEGTYTRDAVNWAFGLDMDEGDNTATIAGATGALADNDLVLIVDDELLGDTQQVKKAFFSTIKDLGGGTLIFNTAAQWDYTTANNAELRQISPLKNILFEGLRFEGQGRHATLPGDRCIFMFYCQEVTVRDCDFYKVDHTPVALQSCFGFTVEDCTMFFDKKGGTNTQVQYGVRIENSSCRGKVSKCLIDGSRHAINTGGTVSSSGEKHVGLPRDVVIRDNWLHGTNLASIATHEWSYNLKIKDNFINGCAAGIEVRQKRMEIIGNTIENITGIAIECNENVSEIDIIDNTIRNTGDHAIYMGSAVINAPLLNCRINGNRLWNIGDLDTEYAIRWSHSLDATPRYGLEICNNNGYTMTASMIYVAGPFHAGRVSDNFAYGVDGTTVRPAYRLNGINRFIVANNVASNIESYGVWVDDDATAPSTADKNLIIGNFVGENAYPDPFYDGSSGVNTWIDNREESTTLRNASISLGAMNFNGIALNTVMTVTDNGAINTITSQLIPAKVGDWITLWFKGASHASNIISNGGGIELAGGVAFDPYDLNDILTLFWDGTSWRESARTEA